MLLVLTEYYVIGDPHYLPGEVRALYDKVRPIGVGLRMNKVLTLVVFLHMLHQLGHRHLGLTRQVHTVDQPVAAVFLVALQGRLRVLHLAAVVGELAAVGHLGQNL